MDTKKLPKLGKEKKPDRPKKKRKLRINWLLIFAIVCVAIPSGALGWILLQAQLETNTPQLGERFSGAFTYELSADKGDIKNIEDSIASLANVEDVKVTLNVATLRVYIDVEDSASETRISEIAIEAYEKIDASYPIDKYFTNGLSSIQYDMEIYVFNDLDREEDLIYYRLIKNAAAETYSLQNVGKALDPELAERLRSEVTAATDGVVGTEDASDTGDEEVGEDE